MLSLNRINLYLCKYFLSVSIFTYLQVFSLNFRFGSHDIGVFLIVIANLHHKEVNNEILTSQSRFRQKSLCCFGVLRYGMSTNC